MSEKEKAPRYRWVHAVGQSKLHLGQKAVLLARLAHTRFDGEEAYSWLSQEQLAADLGCSRRTVNDADRAAVEAGLMLVDEVRPGRSNVYQLVISPTVEFPCTEDRRKGTCAATAHPGEQPLHTQVSRDCSPPEQPLHTPCAEIAHEDKKDKPRREKTITKTKRQVDLGQSSSSPPSLDRPIGGAGHRSANASLSSPSAPPALGSSSAGRGLPAGSFWGGLGQSVPGTALDRVKPLSDRQIYSGTPEYARFQVQRAAERMALTGKITVEDARSALKVASADLGGVKQIRAMFKYADRYYAERMADQTLEHLADAAEERGEAFASVT